jgi:hypothetical protein
MKITKILVALSFLFAVSTANAGELTVTGSMEATYTSEVDRTTGNPLGMDRELKFAGTTELDNGVTVSVMQDTGDSLTYGNSKITFGNVAGLVDIYIGSDGSEIDAIDDITPTAYEEANAMSGTYKDVGGLAGEMGIGVKFEAPYLGTVSAQYVPKADGAKSADNNASGDTNGLVGSGAEVVVKTPLENLPVVGSYLAGLTVTAGYASQETATVANTTDREEATLALTGSYGNLSFGYQRDVIDEGQTVALTDADFYKVEQIGIAYAINDALSLSYNMMEQTQHNVDADGTIVQDTDAINIGYTVGGMTIGFQDASTDNANHVKAAKDDVRSISLSVAF